MIASRPLETRNDRNLCMLRFNNKITYVNAECGRTTTTKKQELYSSNLNAILFFR